MSTSQNPTRRVGELCDMIDLHRLCLDSRCPVQQMRKQMYSNMTLSALFLMNALRAECAHSYFSHNKTPGETDILDLIVPPFGSGGLGIVLKAIRTRSPL